LVPQKGVAISSRSHKARRKPAIGESIKGWVSDIGKYLSTEGAKAGVDVAKRLATKWILQHYGLDAGA
jgi:hypothetical protein